MQVALNIFLTTALFVGVPLLMLWLQERLKHMARESSDRALQDYRHSHEKELSNLRLAHERELASLRATLDRQLQGSSLYLQRRHLVYGALYKHVRMASDQYATMLWLSERPDFAKYTVDDAVEYCRRHKVPKSYRKRVLEAFATQNASAARDLLDDLHDRVERRDAGKSFVRAKSIEALNAVYLSDGVSAAMQSVRSCIARVSVLVEPDAPPEAPDSDERRAMLDAVQQLLQVMRREIETDAGRRTVSAV